MTFAESLHAVTARDHKMKVENRNPIFDLADIQARNLQLRPIDQDSVRDTSVIGFRVEPRFNNHKASIAGVLGHPAYRLSEPGLGLRVSDGAEEAHDNVVSPAKVEFGHVSLMEWDVGQLRSGLRQHPLIEIQAFDDVMVFQVRQMTGGTTANIQEGTSVRDSVTLDELSKPLRLCRVVFSDSLVDKVVVLG